MCSLSTSVCVGGSPSRSCYLGGCSSSLQYYKAAQCAFHLLRTEQLFTFPRSKTHTEAFVTSLAALGSVGCSTKALTIWPLYPAPTQPSGTVLGLSSYLDVPGDLLCFPSTLARRFGRWCLRPQGKH